LPTLLDIDVVTGRVPAADAVWIGLFQGETPPRRLGAPLQRAVARITSRPGWRGEEGQSGETELASRRTLTLTGLGAEATFDASKLRQRIEGAVAGALSAGARRLALLLPAHPSAQGADAAARIARAAALATYRFDRFRSERKRTPRLRSILLVPPAGEGARFREGVATGVAVAAGAALARDLANTPPNEATPAWIASRSRELAARHGAPR
jgi:leucyl aminopeptidase